MPDIPAPKPSLRERKRIKLRGVLIDVAQRLFLARGYEKTTLEQVCAGAETSLRTLLRYFPTKEDLALGREIAVLEEFGETLANLDPSTSVVEFWRERVGQSYRGVDRKKLLKLMALWYSTPTVAAKTLTLQVQYEDLLARALAREAGVDPADDLYGRLLAGLLISGLGAAGRRWIASKGELDFWQLRQDVVDWTTQNFPPRNLAKPGR